MSEAPPDTTAPTADGGDDDKHVYDHALLRYVPNLPGKTASQTATQLNRDDKSGAVAADGTPGKRYRVG